MQVPAFPLVPPCFLSTMDHRTLEIGDYHILFLSQIEYKTLPYV